MKTNRVANPFAAPEHDHANCVIAALNAAEAICAHRGERLTPLRRQVLELIWRGHSPVGAYDLLAMLQDERASWERKVRALEDELRAANATVAAQRQQLEVLR